MSSVYQFPRNSIACTYTATRVTAAPFAATVLATFAILVNPARAVERKVVPASDFVQMIGVNVHMAYTDGAYSSLGNVLRDFKFLGINHARDVLPGADYQAVLIARDAQRRMVFDGIKFNLFFSSGANLSSSILFVRSLEKAVAGSLASIEGYNEINNFPVSFRGQSGPAAAVAGQQALYQAIKAEPDLKNIPVIDMTGFEMLKNSTVTYGASLTGYADLVNLHVYAQNGQQPGIWIERAKSDTYKLMQEDYPKVITEFGYSTKPESGWLVIGVDERTQAKGILNGLFDAAIAGYNKTYLYELLDQKPDPGTQALEFHFGLFTFDNRPKIAAHAIRNLTKVLSEAGGSGTGSQPAGNSNAPPPGTSTQLMTVDAPDAREKIHTLGLARSDGTLIAAIWQETPFWDRAEGQPLEAPAVRARLSFARACGSIKLYDLLQSSEPHSVFADGTILFMLRDYVQLIECVR